MRNARVLVSFLIRAAVVGLAAAFLVVWWRPALLGKSAVPIAVPLHGSANAIAVSEIDIVSHSDFVAVIQDRCAGKGKQQTVQQLDAPAIVVHKRREAPSTGPAPANSSASSEPTHRSRRTPR